MPLQDGLSERYPSKRMVLSVAGISLMGGCGKNPRSDRATSEQSNEEISSTPVSTGTGTTTPKTEMPPPSTEILFYSERTFREHESGPLHLDVVTPDEISNAPVVVFIHGGGWRNGHRGHFKQQAQALAKRGIAGVLIEYRLSGTASYPAAPRDVAAAIKWTRSNAEQFGIDPERLALAGGSAGGHLAALVGLAPGHFDVQAPITAIAGFNGVYDLRNEPVANRSTVQEFIGANFDDAPNRYAEASPITHVDSQDPPTLILHGTEDELVPYNQAQAFRDRLSNAGVPSELVPAEGASHGYFNDDPWYSRTLTRLWSFLAHHL